MDASQNQANYACPKGTLRAVKEGDSVASLAKEAGITPGRLMDMNPYLDPENLTAGQIVCLPGTVRWGRARYGESWGSLAARYGVSAKALEELNPRLDPGALLPGQRCRLPE